MNIPAITVNMDTSIKKIASLVRFHRKKAKLTQLELAKLADIGKTAVFDIEKGKKTVQLDTLLAVFDVLNIQMEFHGPLMPLFEESQLPRPEGRSLKKLGCPG